MPCYYSPDSSISAPFTLLLKTENAPGVLGVWWRACVHGSGDRDPLATERQSQKRTLFRGWGCSAIDQQLLGDQVGCNRDLLHTRHGTGLCKLATGTSGMGQWDWDMCSCTMARHEDRDKANTARKMHASGKGSDFQLRPYLHHSMCRKRSLPELGFRYTLILRNLPAFGFPYKVKADLTSSKLHTTSDARW